MDLQVPSKFFNLFSEKQKANQIHDYSARAEDFWPDCLAKGQNTW